MANPFRWVARILSQHRQIQLILTGEAAELVLGAGLDLADALLGDAEFAAELFEGLLGRAVEAVAARR